MFNIFDDKSKEVYGTVTVTTVPSDIAGYFGTSDINEIQEQMKPDFFETDNMYNGLKSDIVDGFGYELPVDVTGKAYGWNAFYLEFISRDLGKHSIRFYICNDEMNQDFYSMMIKFDIPLEKEDMIPLMRKVLFSLNRVQ